LSSILRALKKLENDSRPSTGIATGPGMTSAAHIREKALIVKWIFVFIIVIGLAISGLFLRKAIYQSKSTNFVITSKNAVPDVTPEQKSSPLKAIVISPQKLPVAKGDNSISPPQEFQESPKIKEESIPQTMKANPMDMGKDLPDAEKSHPINEPAKINPIQQSDLVNRNRPEISEIGEEAGLDLQAISWSSDVKKRLAVINGKLCRENESVGGYVVKQINPDDIMVSKGATTGKLVLKIR